MKQARIVIGLLLIALFVQGCNDTTIYPERSGNNGGGDHETGSATIEDVIGVEWKLVGFQKQTGSTLSLDKVPDGQNFSLTFSQTEAGGMADCKGYGYQYSHDEEKNISFFDPAPQIAMVCPGGSRDAEFYQAMESARSYSATNATLHIYYGEPGEGKALYFVRKESSVMAESILLYRLEVVDPAPSDPYKLIDASITGDELKVKVEYGGGCEKHDFTLIGPLTIPTDQVDIESNLIEPIVLYLQHDANNDACDALITEQRSFDLTPLKERWKEETGRKSGIIQLTINDLHTGDVITLDYVIGAGGANPEDLILGDWTWNKSWNPWTNQITTPATEGYTETRRFSNDGTMTVWRDGVEQGKTDYEIYYRDVSGTGNQELMISFGSGGSEEWLEVSQNQLKLISSPYDGLDMWFVR